MSDRTRILIAIMLSSALLGEAKLNPFGDSFRFSLGIVAYFFGLLWFSVPVLQTGLLTGGAVVAFRMAMDLIGGETDTLESFLRHMPSFCYYLIFALSVKLLRIRKQAEYPIRVGIIGAAADTISNVAEWGVRISLLESAPMTIRGILLIAMVGILRSFFVVGLYNMLSIRQVREQGEWRKAELERLMLLNSSLYMESFFLRKSMAHVEKITRESYRLYKLLLELGRSEHRMALHLAENVHELKKDLQRIAAGLSKLMQPKQAMDRMGIAELCSLAVRANEKVAEAHRKQIEFRLEGDVQLSTNQIYPLLSILNNLLANAVEAIPDHGRICLKVALDGDWLVFRVSDTGPGIAEAEREWVFEPGYTTKFDSEGYPSTGIGLTHAQGLAQSLGGFLALAAHSEEGAEFELRVPVDRLLRRGEADEAIHLSR